MQISMKNKETGKLVGNLKNRKDVLFLLPSLAFYITETPKSIGGQRLFHIPSISHAERYIEKTNKPQMEGILQC